MTRVLPAHVLVGAVVGGLAFANLVRLPRHDALLLALVVGPAPLLADRGSNRRLWLVASVALCLGWWWGSVRLDALDRSVLTGEIGRAEDGLAVTTAEARPGTFVARQFARLRSFGGVRLDERVELELPLGRAPPQGAIVRLLAVVKAPRGPDHGFDERTWLRRQGVHVVLTVDRWQVVGHRGIAAASPTACAAGSVVPLRPGSAASAVRLSRACCSATRTASRTASRTRSDAPGCSICSPCPARTSCCSRRE